jgi:lipopolysaccharide assembly LptE-like protein
MLANRKNKIRAAATVMAAIVAFSGCGYRTAGKGASLPPNIRTIAVPTFVNGTTAYRVEQILTQAVVHEFISRTNYRIANDTNHADATLSGTVTAVYASPLTFDSVTGRLSSAMVTVNMRVSLKDNSSGRVIFENPNYSFHQQYEVSREAASFFKEESPALTRLSQDFARTLVSDILENY